MNICEFVVSFKLFVCFALLTMLSNIASRFCEYVIYSCILTDKMMQENTEVGQTNYT